MAPRSFMNQSTYASARQLQQGSYSGKAGDLLAHTLYDTIPFKSISQSTRFFSAPVGASVNAAAGAIQKTAIHTNMLDSGKLPAGQKFLIKAVRPEMILVGATNGSHTLATYQAYIRVMQAMRMRIVLPGRDFDWETPASVFLPAIPVALPVATGASFNHLYFGAPKLGLDTPIAIGDVDGAPVSFSFETLVDTTDTTVSAALTVLGTAATEAQLRINLLGALVRLK